MKRLRAEFFPFSWIGYFYLIKSNNLNFSEKTKQRIKDAILDRCEGIQHQEFDIANLDSIVADIEAAINAEESELRSLPRDPVVTATSPKLRAKAPRVGQFIDVYARDLQHSVPMEVFDVRGNTVTCGYNDIEYAVRLEVVGNGHVRWEGSND